MNIPSQDITNSSALQIYHMAYRSQYESNDIREACRLYREIIRQFPDSNEAAYAVIQLEKIGAQEALKDLHDNPWQKILPLAALLFSLLALFIAGTALLLVLDKNENSLYDIKTSSNWCYSLLKCPERAHPMTGNNSIEKILPPIPIHGEINL
jgi:hypothetical protein